MEADKLVLVAGTTGAGLREVYNRLSRESDCVFHFEDMVLEPYRLGDCNDIEQLASMTLVSKDEARKAFRAGLDRIRARAGSRGCRKLVVAVHLSYLTQRMVVTNPVLGGLLGLAREVDVVYLVEDYYDVIDVVSRRPRACGPSYRIDPILLLQWRAVDSNLLTSIESVKPGTRTLILGVKHPWETFKRLIDHLSLTRSEALREESVRTAYVSHPITTFRSMYVSPGYRSLESMVMVRAIEAVKEALRLREGLILYEPTSVDELFADPYEKVYDTIRIPLDSDTLKEHLRGAPIDISLPEPGQVNGRTTVLHSLFVSPENRWPFPANNIRRIAGGFEYSHRVRRLSLLDPQYTRLYGVDYYLSMFLDLVTTTRLKISRQPASTSLGGMMQGQVMDLVQSQIEMRDYQYVGQSGMIVAVTTPVIIDRGAERGVYVPVSTGMEAELHRAKALSKPVTIILLPVSLEAAAHGLLEGGGEELAREIAGSGGWRRCSSSTGSTGLRECLDKIVRGGLFGAARGASRGCVLEEITDAGRSSIEGLARDYALGLGSCGVPSSASTSSGYFSMV